jgi:ribosomal protein S18 acetylase RimI-like enzyme
MIAPMAVVDDVEGWRRLVASLRRFYALYAAGSPEAELREYDGVVGSVTPAVPQRSVVNAVVYTDAVALEDAYDRLAAGYDAAGIEAWTVWVPDADTRAAELLADRGHVLDADPEAMVIDLDEVLRPEEPPQFDRGADMETVGRVNGIAYGLGGEFERALRGHSGEGFFTYVAGDGPDACVVLSDEGDDAAVWFVATSPEARGKGLSTTLMAHGLVDARERGLGTSTLQATDAGRPVYERLGYRSLGEIQMWERRK